jgi:GT2 family glycosyltransferase
VNFPKVCIIILNWNGLQDTIECLKSLFELNYQNFEVILVDNGSDEDCSKPIKEKYKNVKLILNRENLGFAAGNNVGIRYGLSKGCEYIWLLNNDTVVEPDTLLNLVLEIEKYPKAGIAASKIYYFNSPQKIWFAGAQIEWMKGTSNHIGLGEIDIGQFNFVMEMDRVTGCSMLIKRIVCEEVGILDEKYFLYAEEVDWCVRARKAGFKCIFVPSSIVYHKVSRSVKKTGSWNQVFEYYNTRNFLYLIKKSFCFPLREIILVIVIVRKLANIKRVCLKMALSIVKSSLKMEPKSSPAVFGIKDFLKGKMGKTTYRFE